MYTLAKIIALGFFCFILWVIYLANTGSNSVFFDFVYSIPYGDKLGHTCLFGFLTLALIIGLKFRTVTIGKISIYHGVTLVILFVVSEELSQAYIPSRTFDFVDLAADILGITLASIIGFVGEKYLTRNSSGDVTSNTV